MHSICLCRLLGLQKPSSLFQNIKCLALVPSKSRLQIIRSNVIPVFLFTPRRIVRVTSPTLGREKLFLLIFFVKCRPVYSAEVVPHLCCCYIFILVVLFLGSQVYRGVGGAFLRDCVGRISAPFIRRFRFYVVVIPKANRSGRCNDCS
jgi:hypothetical protein